MTGNSSSAGRRRSSVISRKRRRFGTRGGDDREVRVSLAPQIEEGGVRLARRGRIDVARCPRQAQMGQRIEQRGGNLAAPIDDALELGGGRTRFVPAQVGERADVAR